MKRLGLLALVCSCLLSACSEVRYYQQAWQGQQQLLQLRQPVTEVLNHPQLPVTTRHALERSQLIRRFLVEQLKLPEHASYSDYAVLQRPWVVLNVFAAPELSLQLHSWCYPVLGCLAYRGYFDATLAAAERQRLHADGWEVYTGAVPAYSSLGWFADPLLDTFIHWPEGRLAELLAHELTHQLYYIADDSAFNEAYASAVGQLGAQRWLAQYGDRAAQQRYANDLLAQQRFLQLVLATRLQLQQLYRSQRSDADKRLAKARSLAYLQQRYQRWLAQQPELAGAYRAWFKQDVNNAKLGALSTYYDAVPQFMALFKRCGEDFVAFHAAVARIGRLPATQRWAELANSQCSSN